METTPSMREAHVYVIGAVAEQQSRPQKENMAKRLSWGSSNSKMCLAFLDSWRKNSIYASLKANP